MPKPGGRYFSQFPQTSKDASKKGSSPTKNKSTSSRKKNVTKTAKKK